MEDYNRIPFVEDYNRIPFVRISLEFLLWRITIGFLLWRIAKPFGALISLILLPGCSDFPVFLLVLIDFLVFSR